jgi:hypothetical protein
MRLSSSRLEATNTLIQTKTEIGIREARGLTEKDRWTIKRDFALEINEMRPRSFITQKFFEDLLLLLPCLLLLSPQLLWPAHLEWRSIMGGKEFTQDHRARERAFAYLFNRALLSHLYPFSYCLSWPTHRPCLNTMLLLDFPSSQFKVYSQYIYDQFN